MARFPGADAVYEVVDLFRQRCLVAGQSLLWPDRHAWTIGTIDVLVGAILGRDDSGEGIFLDKLRDQLADEPDDVLRVAADTLAFYFLFPRSSTVGPEKKLEAIQAIVGWRARISRHRGKTALDLPTRDDARRWRLRPRVEDHPGLG